MIEDTYDHHAQAHVKRAAARQLIEMVNPVTDDQRLRVAELLILEAMTLVLEGLAVRK